MISAMKINIILFQPEIPQNTGNISRTCSATGCVLHLVHPLGFSLDEKHLRRAGLDYWDGLEIHEYNDNDDFFAQHSSKKLWFFSQKGHHNLWEGPMRRILLCFLFLVLGLSLFATGVDSYCYDCLNATEQLAYNAISDCLTHLITVWNCGSLSQETIQKAYNCLQMDHPEIFWSDGYNYVTSYVNNSISGHRVEFNYNLSREEISKANGEIEEALLSMFAEIGRIDASYETVKAVYEYLVRNCSYDGLNLDQSMYSVMVNHGGVCASFAKAFEFIMQCLGIPCTVVYGRLTGSEGILSTTLGHEWNILKLGDSWYHVDVTSALSISGVEEIDYRFLCTTTEDILKTHVIDNPVPIPECSSGDLEFYRYYGLCVDTYSRTELASVMLKAMDMGLGPVARFSNYRAYSEAIDDLFTREGIFQAIRDATGISVNTIGYRLDEELLLLRLDI